MTVSTKREREIRNRTTYHPPTPGRASQHETVRAATAMFMLALAELVPEGPELDHALSKADAAMMWANAGIARRGAILDGILHQ